ncbi:hypothetical protein NE857_04780 [Nocardiopsis exhalans]|uniref:Uncharacterized protein n=1 Tax=Nocardiopsis exhalans TaxID=163604 RepID=A0ABY5DD14_9ACTN|nr:hypothetical protein [Nocardiopsis exhalans]USY20966.1 hypothetical protein NE857_04780 [Nocardiopsis exhalans]
MVLSKIIEWDGNRVARKHGLTYGEAWRDPDLAAALPSVTSGDIAMGLALLGTDDPQLRSLRLHVLSDRTIPLLAKLESGMDQPDPEPDLLMWAGATRVKAAWEVRTSQRARDVGPERFKRFHEMLASAREPLLYAAQTTLTPTALDQLQWFGLGMEIPREEMDQLWERIVALDPHHHCAMEGRLQVLCHKWQGSHEEMFTFAREAPRKAPPGDRSHPLIVRAHFEYAAMALDDRGLDTYGAVGKMLRDYFGDPVVAAEVAGAADRWLSGDPSYPTAAADAHCLGSALYVGGDEQRAAAVLARAGTVVPEYGALWSYLGTNPAARYARVRTRLGIPLPAV